MDSRDTEMNAISSQKKRKRSGGEGQSISRQEFETMIIECLYSLGYRAPAILLGLLSNISYKSPKLSMLQEQVLQGKWDDCIQTLALDEFTNVKDENIRAKVLSAVLQQWIIELLNRDAEKVALEVIRRDYSALGVKKEKIDHLSELLIRKDQIERMGQMTSYVLDDMRKDLATDLEELLPPWVMLPERRLQRLVEKALGAQISSSD